MHTVDIPRLGVYGKIAPESAVRCYQRLTRTWALFLHDMTFSLKKKVD